MATKGFFNPLTGFSVMFPDQRSEDASRERILSGQRDKTAADERMNDRRARSQEKVSSDYSEARRYEADRNLEGDKYKADKSVEGTKLTAEAMKERFMAQEKKVSEQLRRTIWSAANREEQRNKLARSAYQTGVAKAAEIAKAMNDAVKGIKEPKEEDFYYNSKSRLKTAKAEYDLLVSAARQRAAQEKMKGISPSMRQYLEIDPSAGTVTFNGDEPPEFNRERYMMDALKEFGVSFDSVFGDGESSEGQPGSSIGTQPQSQAQPQAPRAQAPFATGQTPDGDYIITVDGQPKVLRRDGTIQPIPRTMAIPLGVPRDMIIPGRIIP